MGMTTQIEGLIEVIDVSQYSATDIDDLERDVFPNYEARLGRAAGTTVRVVRSDRHRTPGFYYPCTNDKVPASELEALGLTQDVREACWERAL